VLAPELDAAERLAGDDKVESFTFDESALDQIFGELAPQPAAAPAPAPAADAFNLAEDFISKGLLDRALGEIRRVAVAGADPVEAALLTGQVFLRQGLDGEALERFDAALVRLEGIEWSAAHTRAWGGRSRALLRLGRLDDARFAAETVRAHAPDRADNLQVLGEVLLQSGEAAEAVRVFGRAVEIEPQDAALLRHLGRAALAAGRAADAERALRMAVKLDPDFVAARVELGKLLLASGLVEDSIRETQAALDILPTYADAAYLLAQAQRAAGRPREAVGTAVDLLGGDPYHLDALVLLGQALMDDARPDDARQAFARVLKFDPARAEALFGLGALAAAERRFREASASGGARWRRAGLAAGAGGARQHRHGARRRNRLPERLMAIEGPLRELALSDVFQLLDLSRKTGTLTVSHEARHQPAIVRFDRGGVVGAQLGDAQDRLGHLLQRAGKVTSATWRPPAACRSWCPASRSALSWWRRASSRCRTWRGSSASRSRKPSSS
jgi:tetratricopeptide (TPR) repeat protein